MKIKTQIHIIVLAYSLFIERQDGRCQYDKQQCFLCRALAGWVGRGHKSCWCKGNGQKNKKLHIHTMLNQHATTALKSEPTQSESWDNLSLLISYLVSTSFCVRSSVKNSPPNNSHCVWLKSPLWRKQLDHQNKAPLYKYIFYTFCK